MAEFELYFNTLERNNPKYIPELGRFGGNFLLRNAIWFVRVRWLVVVMFALLGAVGFINKKWLFTLGFVPPRIWPFYISVVLLAANLFFSFSVRKLGEDSEQGAKVNLWMQIILDLFVVTWFVHMVGSTTTFTPFIYIFHIAMACIFFSPRGSLVVTLTASVLYIIIVFLECNDVFSYQSILVLNHGVGDETFFVILFKVGSAVIIWIITWFLVSSLSRVVKFQEENLLEINKRLLEANREKTMRVLVTTHELKTPFSDIETLINMLKYKNWSTIPKPVQETILIIAEKSKTMRSRIGEILMLGNLRMQMIDSDVDSSVDIEDLLAKVVESLGDLIVKKDVVVNTSVSNCLVSGTFEHLSTLFSNLIVNAISYSRRGGIVNILMEEKDEAVVVEVADSGIGIKEDALPHIFDEYYRTDEGKKFNSSSTGLGLTIVKEIAKNYKYGIKVKSEIDVGTTFKITIPKRIKI